MADKPPRNDYHKKTPPDLTALRETMTPITTGQTGAIVGVTPKVTAAKSVTVTGGASGDDLYVQQMIQARGPALVMELFGLAFSPDVKPNIKLSTILALLDRGYGKPTQRTETHTEVADITSLHLQALKDAAKR